MNLPFSTKWKHGEPTNFIEKIIHSLYLYTDYDDELKQYLKSYEEKFGQKLIVRQGHIPKRHTIRKKRTGRNKWKVGSNIHFCINNRSKNYFRFAPIIPVTKIQTIQIFYLGVNKEIVSITIDDKIYYHGFVELACNNERVINLSSSDGFDTTESFFEWFNSDFDGELIHWTPELSY